MPILLVHGAGLTSRMWSDLVERLVVAGYERSELLALDLRVHEGSNPAAARQSIAPAVEDLLARAAVRAKARGLAAPTRVDVVAHSMGAISSRWYIAFMRPERIRLWLGVTPANHGTDAICGFDTPGPRELCPAFAKSARESRVQLQLNGTPQQPRDESPYGIGADEPGIVAIRPDATRCVAYYGVRIEPDEWIKPERSALLNGAGGLGSIRHDRAVLRETTSGNFLFTGKTTHDDLARHPQFAEFVLTLLESADSEYERACTQRREASR